jgi:meso-butanediol dehydrogenase / (S,S)-butanediol dehydrogenase / diacetyl reductase
MGKVIVITGAGSGLGRAVARRLAASGDSLVLLGRTVSKIELVARELRTPAAAVQCDVTSPDSVRMAFAAIANKHPQIDVLINNAAVYAPFFIKDATDSQISAALSTNFAGPIYCSRSAIPLMRRGAHIINVSSETVSLPYAMFSLYQSTKAGLERFTTSLHEELAPEGIRVTLLRAGQMFDEDMAWTVDPAILQRFAQENIQRGIDVRARPSSHFTSAAEIFRALIDLPPDINIPTLVSEGRQP